MSLKRLVVVIKGPDAEKALTELISNAEFDKLDVIVWTVDNPEDTQLGDSTLAYMPSEE